MSLAMLEALSWKADRIQQASDADLHATHERATERIRQLKDEPWDADVDPVYDQVRLSEHRKRVSAELLRRAGR